MSMLETGIDRIASNHAVRAGIQAVLAARPEHQPAREQRLEILQAAANSEPTTNQVTPHDLPNPIEPLTSDEIDGLTKLAEYGGQLDFVRINACLQKAKRYIESYLKIPLPQQFNELPKIATKSDIKKLLRKTVYAGSQDTLAPFYCTLAKATWAYLESGTAEMESAQQHARELHDRFFQPIPGSREVHFTCEAAQPAESDSGTDLTLIQFWEGGLDSPAHSALLSGRSKTEEGRVSKLLTDVHLVAKTAVSDEVALRFEVNTTSEALKLLSILADAWKADTRVPHKNSLRIKNSLITDPAAIEAIQRIGVRVEQNGNAGSKDFAAAKIYAKMMFGPVERTVEVQIVIDAINNEKGLKNHYFYELVARRAQVVSRLFGRVPDDLLRLYIDEALEKYDDLRELYPDGRYPAVTFEEAYESYTQPGPDGSPFLTRLGGTDGKPKWCETKLLARRQKSGLAAPAAA